MGYPCDIYVVDARNFNKEEPIFKVSIPDKGPKVRVGDSVKLIQLNQHVQNLRKRVDVTKEFRINPKLFFLNLEGANISIMQLHVIDKGCIMK